ncbi:MAG: hypothetical protein HY721_09520 [Planctomycetes bacterium]|nr:hypothetical protein [Planctomycetota bacterium]
MKRLAWQLTRAGRTRNAIWRAYRAPQDPRSLDALSRRLEDLRVRADGSSGSAVAVIHEGNACCAWRSLEVDSRDDAQRWLAALDGADGGSPDRVALRWMLLRKLLDAGDLESYLEEAAKFLQDPLTSPDLHAGAIVETVQAIYERESPQACAEAIAELPDGWRKRLKLEGVLALCRASHRFGSRAEARATSALVDPADPCYTEAMRWSALLVRTRAAEWEGDWSAMQSLAREAARLASGDPGTRYWLARALLHTPGTRPGEVLAGPRLPSTDEWERLRRAIQLHEGLALSDGKSVVQALLGKRGGPDPQEKALLFDVLRRAIALERLRTPGDLSEAAGLSAEVEKAGGELPWTQIVIAAKEIRVDRRYAAAAARLEKALVAREPLAPALSWLARTLGKLPPPAGAGLDDARRWMGELDQRCAGWQERVPARWTLLEALLAASRDAEHAEEARAFLADPLTRRGLAVNPKLEAAARSLAGKLYERKPERCAAVLESLDPALRASLKLDAALALCRVPGELGSADAASSWAAAVDPAHLAFSRLMRGKALLVRARAAEWEGRWRDMETLALEARQLLPGDIAPRYWVSRARLHLPGGQPEEGFVAADGEGWPPWVRLEPMIDLYREPTLERARGLLPVILARHGDLDSREVELAVSLLRPVLEVTSPLPPGDVAGRAALCEALRSLAGRLPWAEVGIAEKEIWIDGRHAEAVVRLEVPDVASSSPARFLARVARLLAGMAPPAARDPDALLSLLEEAAFRVLGAAAAADEVADASVAHGLEAARSQDGCLRAPALASTAAVLAFALGVLAKRTEGAVPPEAPPSVEAPPAWVRWVHARACLLRWAEAGDDAVLRSLDASQPAVAWAVEGWWALYGYGDAGLSARARELIEESGRCLDEVVKSTRSAAARVLSSLRASRRRGHREDASSCDVEAARGLWGLGEVSGDVLLEELRLEADMTAARHEIANGRGRSASHRFDELIAHVERSLPPLCRAWWLPALRYWRGVAVAEERPAEARESLVAVAGGPKGLEARAQLAVLALRDGDLEAAGRWIADLPPRFPGILYARALLLERRGQAEEARRLLDSFDAFDAAFPGVETPYRLAALRLAAALEERRGNDAEAERMHRKALRASAGDPVTSARLGRILVRRAYAAGSTAGGSGEKVGELLERGGKSIGWCAPYASLHRILSWPAAGLGGLRREVDSLGGGSRGALPFVQLYARRLLEAGKLQGAWEALAGRALEGAPSSLRTRLVLKAWRVLSRVWRPVEAPAHDAIAREARKVWEETGRGRDDRTNWFEAERRLLEKARAGRVSMESIGEAATCLEELDLAFPSTEDAVLRRWRYLLARAVEIGRSPPSFDPGSWRELAPWPGASVAGLWAADPARRAEAAGEVLAALGTGRGSAAAWREEPAALLGAICAWLHCRDADYLEAYSRLEPILDRLPADVDLWLAAASAHFRAKRWSKLLKDDLPACVADLADPRVRLLIGLAYARETAESVVKGDLAKAREGERKARSALQEIIAADVTKGG